MAEGCTAKLPASVGIARIAFGFSIIRCARTSSKMTSRDANALAALILFFLSAAWVDVKVYPLAVLYFRLALWFSLL